MKKRLLSLALVLAMILSLGCTVLAASVNDYVDIPQNAWYRGAVDYVLQRGYMVGATNNQFNPEGAVTRAQIAQIFYAMNGKPSAGKQPKFSDVSKDAWYAAAVNWAATFGVVSGYPDGSYHPMEFITRQQLATILYKYAQLKGYAAEGEGRGIGLGGYADVQDVGSWAWEAMAWCVHKGVISGSNIGLEPNAHATRAQIAAILRTLMKNVREYDFLSFMK